MNSEELRLLEPKVLFGLSPVPRIKCILATEKRITMLLIAEGFGELQNLQFQKSGLRNIHSEKSYPKKNWVQRTSPNTLDKEL